jgi:maltose-binding protein MalE
VRGQWSSATSGRARIHLFASLSFQTAVSQQRDKLIVNAAAGTAPELFSDSSNVMGMWVDNGLAKPLDTYLAKWPDRSDLIPATLADLKYFGKTYAVPSLDASAESARLPDGLLST